MMEQESYQTCLGNTKALLADAAILSKTASANNFTTLFEDCKLCISQCLDKVSTKSSNEMASLNVLCKYIDDAVTVLQMLSKFIKHVIEIFPMSCREMKTFPIATGHIISEVFSHCRDSPTVYGVHIPNLKTQLKDLFRNGHELQQTYLIVLEKHFLFDLSEKEELSILLEALNINLRIAEIVDALDVKTMSEQWKGYTAICDKYSSYLMDLHAHQEFVKLLSSMILNDVNIALEGNEDDKSVLRSIKKAKFCLKILQRMCAIFQHSTVKPHQNIVDLFIRIYVYNPPHLDTVYGKSTQFIANMDAHVFNPTGELLAELVREESFLNVIVNYNIQDIKKNDELLGFVILIVKAMKICLEREERSYLNKLMFALFSILPDCFVWCNMGLSFEISAHTQPLGLFEYLLANCAASALIMHGEDIVPLERWMYEALMGTDSFVALFAAKLWTVLARTVNNNQLVSDQVIYLCEAYQKLQEAGVFNYSPQKLHLTYTISALFESLNLENRFEVYAQFAPLATQKNISLWSVLKIKNLPIDYQRNIEIDIVCKVSTYFKNFRKGIQADTVSNYINSLKLAATCSLQALKNLQYVIIESWLIACPKNLRVVPESIDENSLWYFGYLESLVAVTRAMKTVLCANTSNVVKVLHVLSGITLLGNTELTLLVIDLLCTLGSYQIHDENQTQAATLITDAFRNIITCNFTVRNRLFATVYNCESKYLELLVASIVNGDSSLMKAWQHCDPSFRKTNTNFDTLKEKLSIVSDFKYSHKCISRVDNQTLSGTKDNSSSNNFDFADIDTLFEAESANEAASKISDPESANEAASKISDPESDSEPASKKMKLDTEVEDILKRIEKDVIALHKIKSDVFTNEHKRKLRKLQEKLIDLAT